VVHTWFLTSCDSITYCFYGDVKTILRRWFTLVPFSLHLDLHKKLLWSFNTKYKCFQTINWIANTPINLSEAAWYFTPVFNVRLLFYSRGQENKHSVSSLCACPNKQKNRHLSKCQTMKPAVFLCISL
jgi:hypothetical protein